MYLLILFLYKPEYLDELISILTELGVEETSVIEGQSMNRYLAYEVPIFAGLRSQIEGKRSYTKVILSFTDDEHTGEKITALLKDTVKESSLEEICKIGILKLNKFIG